MAATTRQITGANGTTISTVVIPNVLGTTGDSQAVTLTDATGATAITPLQAGGAVSVSNFPSTQPVSAASLPLPNGAATDGTDSTDANATQATSGVGIRGWMSTLISLFRAGTAKVSIRLLTATDVVTVAKVYTPIQTEATTNTRTATGGTTVYQQVAVPITLPASFNPTELGLAGTLGPLTFATNGTPAGQVQVNLEHQDASGRWTQIWSSGAITANAGTAAYPTASIGAGLSTNSCFTNSLRWNYIFTGTFTTASLTEQMTIWGK